METPKDESQKNSVFSRAKWLIITGIIIIIVGGGLTYEFFVQRDNTNTGTTINSSPSTQQQNLNTVDTNLNTPINTTPETPVNSEPDTVANDIWHSITYQKGDHGIVLDVPVDWVESFSGMGFRDGDYLISTYAGPAANIRLSMNVIYHKNESNDTLAEWVEKFREEKQKNNPEALSEPVESRGKQTYQVLTPVASSDYGQLYGFVAGEQRIYEIIFSGSSGTTELVGVHGEAIQRVLKSFDFIDPLPLVTIPETSETTSMSANQGYALSVSWNDDPQPLNFVDPEITTQDADSASGSLYVRRTYYDVGTITNGRYATNKLVDILEWGEGPVMFATLYRVVYDPQELTFIYLEKYSGNLMSLSGKFVYDVGSTVPDLDIPDQIAIPNSSVKLVAETFEVNRMLSYYQSAKEQYKSAGGVTVYFHEASGCYLIERPDGIVKLYYLRPTFMKDFKSQEYFSSSNSFIPQVTWTDGSVNSKEYTFNEPTGGCGTSNCHAIFTDEQIGGVDVLQGTGKTSTGDTIYEYKNNDAQVLKDTYRNYYVPQEEQKSEYDVFVQSHPLFYWKDPFGHWVRFKQTNFLPMVECGKPVIYLYPEQSMNVHVQVNPNGGFSITDPVYPEGGWNVFAHPDGKLDYADGATYPYLFWEGKGINYTMPDRGFVIAKEEVAVFFDDTLRKLGLNAQETEDFKEFWVPRMQDRPYYFITFVDQAVFDTLAPITVTPRPDTIIRVFMDYRGLDAPIPVAPLPIIPPVRHGFSVVEWGGALH